MRLAIQRAVIAFDKLQTGTRSLTPRPPQPPAKTRRLWHVTATLPRGTACAAIQCRIAESKVSAAAGRLRLFIGETCVDRQPTIVAQPYRRAILRRPTATISRQSAALVSSKQASCIASQLPNAMLTSGVPHPFTLCNAKEQPMSGCGTTLTISLVQRGPSAIEG